MPRFEYFTDDADPERTLLVDGTARGFRSLSHWPGNSTPATLKRDLSTEIALAYAALPPAEQEALVGPFEVVANNHFDTDGALSVWAVLQPEAALARSELLIDTAAAGDFSVWRGPEALALDLSVLALSSHPRSPALEGVARDASDHERWDAAYRFVLADLPAMLDDPWRHAALFTGREQRVLAQLEQIGDAALVQVERLPEEDLAIVTTRLPLQPVPLHEACGDLHRVLVIHAADDGPRYRFCYRDESWFELVDKRPLPLPRVELEPLRAELAAREPEHDGARWWAEGIRGPVPRLGFGRKGPPKGFFLDLELSRETPSRLAPEEVVDVVRAGLRGG